MVKVKGAVGSTGTWHYTNRFEKYTSEINDVEFQNEINPVKTNEIPYKDDRSEVSIESDAEDTTVMVDINYLRSLDPKKWKEQDHYAVLGLEKLRYKATDDNLEYAYRKIFLKHFPDKRRAQGEEISPDNDYFTCIIKAYEILGTPNKRRSYDSVDPKFNNAIPTEKELEKDFFKVFPKYFQLNARWSEKKNVPLLGDKNTSREKVEQFYDFWFSFESWREFSYLDEEKVRGQSKEERKHIEKQNRIARTKRKKEEMTRIRTLVDLAYNKDPRIRQFKQEYRDRKLAAKRAKRIALQARKEEEKRLQEEADLATEGEEAIERARQETIKRDHKNQKKALKKERKKFRETCKINNYFSKNAEENLAHVAAVERICELFKLDELETLNIDLKENGRKAFIATLKQLQQTADDAGTMKFALRPAVTEWTTYRIQLLLKAVSLFLAGTKQSWEVITNFLIQHIKSHESQSFNAKEILTKAEDLQGADFSQTDFTTSADKQVKTMNNYAISRKTNKVNSSKKNSYNKNNTPRSENTTKNGKKPEGKAGTPWTLAEQQLLQLALKTYSNAMPNRWSKIAQCIPNRSKKDCVRCYKELIEDMKVKRAAAQKK